MSEGMVEEDEAAVRERHERERSWLAGYLERTRGETRRVDRGSHEAYKGGRKVLRTTTCGWCRDGKHGDEWCRHETAWYERLWVCACECNAGWVAQDVGSGEIVETPVRDTVAGETEETGGDAE